MHINYGIALCGNAVYSTVYVAVAVAVVVAARVKRRIKCAADCKIAIVMSFALFKVARLKTRRAPLDP